ncbi:Aste57867_15778 [Aphanomyces stellatus]|uniref:Aste57867_15778 protein n=1 Tax=Aphanomyces stellatus TaxID=120398 RepID=A0A485L3U9_9STRA|nr:hypothetical protein As57867_015722 [Aphanomyces stellatus]VFT92566.1 Aste57867_15778 [Aphanomyces stellatus]
MDCVWRCPDLIRVVTQFQPGVVADHLPLVRMMDASMCLALPFQWRDNGRTSICRVVQAFDVPFKPFLTNHATDLAAALARLFVAQPHFCIPVLYHAIFHDRMDVLEVVVQHRAIVRSRGSLDDDDASRPLTTMPSVLDFAAWCSSVDIVAWLHTAGFHGCSTDAMDTAAHRGNLPLVRFLHTHRTEGCTVDAMDSAARHGHLDVVMFLHRHRTEGCTTLAMDWAAGNGHLNVVTFLHTHRTEGCTVDAMDAAAERGHVDVVTFLHRHRTEGCTARARDRASSYNLTTVVQYLDTHEIKPVRVDDLSTNDNHLRQDDDGTWVLRQWWRHVPSQGGHVDNLVVVL